MVTSGWKLEWRLLSAEFEHETVDLVVERGVTLAQVWTSFERHDWTSCTPVWHDLRAGA